MCDIPCDMSTLSDYIKSQPPKTYGQWAQTFAISRPYLYGLMDGTRNPSPQVAIRIAEATGGAVPVDAWPNFEALAASIKGAA